MTTNITRPLYRFIALRSPLLAAVAGVSLSIGGCALDAGDLDPGSEDSAESTGTESAAVVVCPVGPNLSNRNFTGANFERCVFQGYNVSDSTFNGADLDRVSFYGATGNRAKFNPHPEPQFVPQVQLNSAIFTGATFTYAQFKEARLNSAKLDGATLSFSEFTNAQLAGATVQGANLYKAKMNGVTATGLVCIGADMRAVTAVGSSSNFQNASCWGANLSGAFLDGSDWRGANLEGADLRNGTIRGIDFRGTDLDHANLCNTSRNGLIKKDQFTSQVGTQCPI